MPVYDVDAFYCSQHQRLDSILSRKIIGLTEEYQGQLIECYSCHINLPNCDGENQLDNVRYIVERSQSANLKILMGDFNTDAISDQQAYQQIKSLGLFDTFEMAEQKDSGITVEKAIDGWKGHSEEKRLDYIFLNQAKRVLSSQVIFNGKNNILYCDKHVHLTNSILTFNGNNSVIYLCRNKHLYKLDIVTYNNSAFYVGQNNYFNGKLSAILSEQKHNFIGDDGLFSFGIWMRIADPHLIYHTDSKKRINPTKSI